MVDLLIRDIKSDFVMKKPDRKQIVGVAQFGADVAGVFVPGASLAGKALIKGAELLIDRRRGTEEAYEGSPGFLLGRATTDIHLYDLFGTFAAKSDVASNINIALRQLPDDHRRRKVGQMWQIVLDNWGSGSDRIFLMTAVLTGSADLLAELPEEAAEVRRRCVRCLNGGDLTRVRFVESMAYCLQWCGDEELNAQRQLVQLSTDWGLLDFLSTVEFLGSKWGVVNDIVSGISDPASAADRRTFEVGRYINYLKTTPWDEFSSDFSKRNLASLFVRLKREPSLLRAAEQALRQAADVSRNRHSAPS